MLNDFTQDHESQSEINDPRSKQSKREVHDIIDMVEEEGDYLFINGRFDLHS
jgi:hypothetical protein